MTEVVDATVVEVVETVDELRSALPAVVPTRHEVLRPLAVADQKAAMDEYQEGLKSILSANDWQDAGRGERFVKKSGWRKIAAWFSLSIELVTDEVERDDDGQVCRAKVWARAVAPNGRFADGDGYCDVTESRFEKNKKKLENDLRGTATTRAVNRAISNLVGMGAVSAEEVDGGGQHGPPFGEAATPELVGGLSRALMWAFDDDAEQAEAAFEQIKADAGGYIPGPAAGAVVNVLAALRAKGDEA